MMVVDKTTNQILGDHATLDDVVDVGLKFLLEPFVKQYSFYVFKDQHGNFGVASSKKCILREVLKDEKAH